MTENLTVSAIFESNEGPPIWAWAVIGVAIALAAVGLTYLRVIQRRQMRQRLLAKQHIPPPNPPK